MSKKLYLCYVDGSFAYFTDNLEDAWGDDWDDAPYEHNAGEPYVYAMKVAFDGVFEQPRDTGFNSGYSVRDINAGCIAWLRGWSHAKDVPVAVPAGIDFETFVSKIRLGGGDVYMRIENEDHE